MSTLLQGLLLLALLPISLTVAADTLYKSIGPDGAVSYSNKPPTVGRVEKTLQYLSVPSSPLPDYALRFKTEMEQRLQRQTGPAAASSAGLQLFTTSWCGFCRKAKAYLAKRQVAYTEYDIETREGMEALVRAGGGQGVPILVWRDQRIQGFDEAAYEAFLASAR